jgi:hypothetical protein
VPFIPHSRVLTPRGSCDAVVFHLHRVLTLYLVSCSSSVMCLAATMGVIDNPATKKTTMLKWFLTMALIFVVALFGSTLPRREEGEGVIEHAFEEVEEVLGIVDNDDADEAAPAAADAPAEEGEATAAE